MLTIKEIEVLDKPGMYGDGDGLYVQVKPAKNGVRKSWVFRYALAGRTRYMGLGSYPEVSAAAAREKVRAARKLLADGIDPIVQRDTELANTQTAQKTFREAAEAYYAAKHMPWSKQTQRVFGYIFTNHVFPVIGDMRVADVRKGDILRVLKNTEKYPAGFWYEKTPTAKRCQGIIKAIFDYAITHDLYPQGLNPAEWNILKGALPKPQEINPTENHPALPWRRIGEFMAHLREIGDRTIHGNDRQAVSAWVMELQILTAARPGEAAGARWSEIRIDERMWVIPGFRMKEGWKHEVPLSDAALAVFERAEKLKVNDWVFPGRGLGRINKVGPWELLHKMGYLDENGIPISLHGFRSTFSEWGNTATKYDWQLIELALAHNIKPGVRGDYFRGKLPEQRRPLMEDWGNFCSKPWQQAEVVHLFEKTGND